VNVVVTVDARTFRGAVGVTAWTVLEELLLDAGVDDRGALIARTNVRRLAAQLGVSKDTAARALNRLARAGVVRRVVAERGAGGALPTSSYVIELVQIDGVTVDIDAHDVESAPSATDVSDAVQPVARRRTTRPASRIDGAQTSLFDLPASAS